MVSSGIMLFRRCLAQSCQTLIDQGLLALVLAGILDSFMLFNWAEEQGEENQVVAGDDFEAKSVVICWTL